MGVRILVTMIVLTGCGSYTRQDVALESAFAATVAVDYAQTREIAASGHEANPLMGAHGDRVPPEVYFPTVLAAHAALVYAVPKQWRPVLQVASVLVSAANVERNWAMGYEISW